MNNPLDSQNHHHGELKPDHLGDGSHHNHAGHHGYPGHHHQSGHGDHSHHHQAASGQYKASFTFEHGTPQANEQTEIEIQILHPDGSPVTEFKESHEKLSHLIVVSQDLSFFNHIHPEYKGNGKFTVTTSFPAGGRYKAIIDVTPDGDGALTLSEWIQVEGEEAGHVPITPDENTIKQIAGKEVELTLSSDRAKEDVTLTYEIRDAVTKQGIDDLEQYLGAVGHVVILSADAEQYIHVHPTDEHAAGPIARFSTVFPKQDVYKIWGQFQHKGEVFTVPFVVQTV